MNCWCLMFDFRFLKIKWMSWVNIWFLSAGLQWVCSDVLLCRRGWILWVLAPSSWTSRLSPRGSSSSARAARRRCRSGATACPARGLSPRPSPSDPTSTARSSSCESHENFFILLLSWGNFLSFNCQHWNRVFSLFSFGNGFKSFQTRYVCRRL